MTIAAAPDRPGTGSDLQHAGDDEISPKKASRQILRQEIVAARRDAISQVVLVWLVTTALGFSGLHHVIAGTVEVLVGAFARQGVWAEDSGRFLVWATLGNTPGGVVFVAFLKYGHARPEAQPA